MYFVRIPLKIGCFITASHCIKWVNGCLVALKCKLCLSSIDAFYAMSYRNWYVICNTQLKETRFDEIIKTKNLCELYPSFQSPCKFCRGEWIGFLQPNGKYFFSRKYLSLEKNYYQFFLKIQIDLGNYTFITNINISCTNEIPLVISPACSLPW